MGDYEKKIYSKLSEYLRFLKYRYKADFPEICIANWAKFENESTRISSENLLKQVGGIFDVPQFFDSENSNDKWLTTVEAAEYLGTTPAKLRNDTHLGKVKFYKYGRLNRYRKADLDSLLEKQ